MARNSAPRPRSNLRDERWFEPNFGVLHRVQHTDELDFMFTDLQEKLDELPPVKIYDDAGRKTAERPVVTLFSPERLCLRVVERRITQAYGKRSRFVWHPADRARIQQSIADDIGRFDLGGRVIRATMAEVHRFGDPDAAQAGSKLNPEDDRRGISGGRSLGITPAATSLEAEFFATEHEIAVNGLPDRVRAMRTTAPYLPHIGIGRIHMEATPLQVTKAIETIGQVLPIELVLNPVEFTPRRG